MRLRIRAKARRDLDDILDYSVNEHGEAIAEAYLLTLGAALDRLVDHPELGLARSDLAEGLRSLSAGGGSDFRCACAAQGDGTVAAFLICGWDNEDRARTIQTLKKRIAVQDVARRLGSSLRGDHAEYRRCGSATAAWRRGCSRHGRSSFGFVE